jgi:hypothetical protein
MAAAKATTRAQNVDQERTLMKKKIQQKKNNSPPII